MDKELKMYYSPVGKVIINPEGSFLVRSNGNELTIPTKFTSLELKLILDLCIDADKIYDLLVEQGFREVRDILKLTPPFMRNLEDKDEALIKFRNIQKRLNGFLRSWNQPALQNQEIKSLLKNFQKDLSVFLGEP